MDSRNVADERVLQQLKAQLQSQALRIDTIENALSIREKQIAELHHTCVQGDVSQSKKLCELQETCQRHARYIEALKMDPGISPANTTVFSGSS